MTILKLKSNLLTLTALIIFALTVNVTFGQSTNATDTPLGINVTSQNATASVMHFFNPAGEMLGGFQMRKYSPTNFQSGLLDSNGQFNYRHATGARTDFLVSNNTKMSIYNNGQVIIGRSRMLYEGFDTANDPISSGEYKLFVETGILTEKVKVAGLETSDWADYVFEEDYEMLPIDDLEDYVNENKHLPNVPSAQEVADNGLDLAKTDATLLEKIEESHLYIIELNNMFKELRAENNTLKADLEAMKGNQKSQN